MPGILTRRWAEGPANFPLVLALPPFSPFPSSHSPLRSLSSILPQTRFPPLSPPNRSPFVSAPRSQLPHSSIPRSSFPVPVPSAPPQSLFPRPQRRPPPSPVPPFHPPHAFPYHPSPLLPLRPLSPPFASLPTVPRFGPTNNRTALFENQSDYSV